MMRLNKDYVWPIIGLAAVGFSAWLLFHQLRDISFDDIVDSLNAIPVTGWLLSALATLLAYAALAGYDRLALLHLRKKISWGYIAAASFTAYAIGHNIGASVFSGAVVRYRAYTAKGLSGADVGVLVAFCSFTFTLGSILLGGIVLLIEPRLLNRFFEDLALWVPIASGVAMLAMVGLYVVGSSLRLKSLRIRNFRLQYPRLHIVLRQLIIGPLELIGAAAIIYFALPSASNPGFLLVLGIFLASFSAALVSHAPGGLGVLEVVFLLALPDVNPADVIAALLVFRLFYLLIPFALSLVIVLLFEHDQWLQRWRLARKPPKE
ncbi:lysylphosphatidylglycerol synthase domain-containing protein [Cellvibrio sp. PSBB006]|uniref:lysylphosphatidylglycerol synthase domain-containing protein n=1 Tax=Cellvibrio sp. PSBB006 TaxID=1987723 RepID=UPI000B3B809D|nr:lysylphosphatidylglycerol synthase domain-containing protein [Cellvibrio sp. PSBB006]